MSLGSVLFIGMLAAGTVWALRRMYSEKPPARDASSGFVFDPSISDATTDAPTLHGPRHTLQVARWVPISTSVTFPEAPYNAGRSNFSSPV